MKNILLALFIGTFSLNALSDITDTAGTHWPIPEWGVASLAAEKMNTPKCKNFINFSTKSKKFLTEGLVVIKDGVLQYESYDSHYGIDIPHALWSVSKTITGSLLGITVDDGKISLEQNLNEFYPKPNGSSQYQNIKVKNLFYLDTGFIWEEFYSGDITNSAVLNMLYGTGHKDMANFVSSKEIIPEGPGFRFNYSTGTPTITTVPPLSAMRIACRTVG